MPAGSFVVFRDENNVNDIHFQQAPDAVPTDEEIDLITEITKVNTAIKVIFSSDKPRFEEYFTTLLSLSQAGLVGLAALPKLASRALAGLKEEIVLREGPRAKNRYLRELGIAALISGGASAIAALLALAWMGRNPQIAYFFLLWTGAMAGSWLSFGSRKSIYTLEDLAAPEKDFVAPTLRLIFTGLLTVILGLLFATQSIVVTIGNMKTDTFTSDVKTALLIGALCGISEQLLSMKVSSQAAQLLNFGSK